MPHATAAGRLPGPGPGFSQRTQDCAPSPPVRPRCAWRRYYYYNCTACRNDPRVQGAPEDAELALFTSYMQRAQSWVAAANAQLGAKVQITSVALDSEKFGFQNAHAKATGWGIPFGAGRVNVVPGAETDARGSGRSKATAFGSTDQRRSICSAPLWACHVSCGRWWALRSGWATSRARTTWCTRPSSGCCHTRAPSSTTAAAAGAASRSGPPRRLAPTRIRGIVASGTAQTASDM